VHTVFSQTIDRVGVGPNNTAEATFEVEKLEIALDGKPLGQIPALPDEARKVKGNIDEKGNTTFFKLVTVYQLDQGMFLGVASKPNGLTATASAGDTQIQLFASIDPQTGQVQMGASLEDVPPTVSAVQLKATTPAIDTLPKELAQLFRSSERQRHRWAVGRHGHPGDVHQSGVEAPPPNRIGVRSRVRFEREPKLRRSPHRSERRLARDDRGRHREPQVRQRSR
jgi:hypothetical protein